MTKSGHKTNSDTTNKICISQLKKNNLLAGFAEGTIISYDHYGLHPLAINLQISLELMTARFRYLVEGSNGKSKPVDYIIYLDQSECHYDGFRYWFSCPLVKEDGNVCRRRVGALYKPWYGSNFFGCRHCHRIMYSSSNLSGQWKKLGQFYSLPELERLEEDLWRPFYKKQPTKRLLRYFEKKKKTMAVIDAKFASLDRHIEKMDNLVAKFRAKSSKVEK